MLYWVLILGLVYLTIAGWVRMGYAIQSWYWLNFSGIHPGPLYLAISGGLWGLVGLIAVIWVILRRPGYRLLGMGAAVFFALTYWIDRLFIVTDPGGIRNNLFAALFTLLLLAFAILVLRPFAGLRSLLDK